MGCNIELESEGHSIHTLSMLHNTGGGGGGGGGGGNEISAVYSTISTIILYSAV